MLPSSADLVSTSQSGENILPSFDVTPFLSNSSYDRFLILIFRLLLNCEHTCTSHLLSSFVSYSNLPSSYSVFIYYVDSYSVLKFM